jgi:O-antigen ligase
MSIARPRHTVRRRKLASFRERVESRAEWPHVAAALLGFSVLASVGAADGGVFPRTWRLATLALSALAAAALLGRTRVALTRLEWAVIALLAAFAAWTAASGSWSGRSSVSILQAERSIVYAVGILAVLLVVERASVPHLLAGMVGGITSVSAYGLGQYLFDRLPLDPFEGELLFHPLGYANALGIFAAIGILLAGGLAVWARSPFARAAALLPLVVLVPTLYFTSSRGAWLAVAAALPVLLRFGGRVGLPGIALLVAVATVAVVAVLAASGGPDRLFHLPGENRAQYWQVAWQDYEDHPLLGSGAGTYGEYWLAHRGRELFTRTAHNVYLQSLAELGPVGLVLLVTALGLPLVRLRGCRDPLVAAAAAGYVAFVLHAGIDWDWEMPAVGLAGIFCGAALLVATRGQPRNGMPVWVRAGLIALLVALVTVALVRLGSGPRTPFGP